MKNIVIFGASGRVGKRLVEYSLAEQHRVTAFIRDPEKIKVIPPGLRIVIGDISNKEQVENAIEGQDIVLSGLGRKSGLPDYSSLTTGIENILSGMEKFSVKRFINVVGSGILNDTEYGLRRNRPGYPEFFKNVSAENWKVYESLQKSTTNWTMVCAPEMTNGERTGIYRTLLDFLPNAGNRISVEDVADYIIKSMDEVNTYKKRIGIAY